jgi:hypothetical protein
MPKITDLANKDLILPVVNAGKAYIAAAKKDETLKLANWPAVQVYVKGGATIILLPEAHDSENGDIHKAAAEVATAVLKVPNVRVAVEMPIKIKGNFLIADVGWQKTPGAGVGGTELFDLEHTARGSIAHNIAFMDAKKSRSVRCNGEANPRAKPQTSMKIQESMRDNLVANASTAGQILVYPVGMNHMTTDMYAKSLGTVLAEAGWALHT